MLLNCGVGKTLESHLNCKEIQPLNPKGNQSWIFIGRTDAEAPICWPPYWKNWLIRKDPDAGKDWRWEEKGTAEDVMVGWHHRFNGHKFEQALGVGDGQGTPECCSPWGLKESYMTEQLNWTDGSLRAKEGSKAVDGNIAKVNRRNGGRNDAEKNPCLCRKLWLIHLF